MADQQDEKKEEEKPGTFVTCFFKWNVGKLGYNLKKARTLSWAATSWRRARASTSS